MKFLLIYLTLVNFLSANIQLIKKGNPDSNTTLLVIGGIHGNEPGGYNAASILASHYKIISNSVWVVPNLNKASIMANKRGIHGDMNRKFAKIKKRDKDKKIVDGIKKIILNKKVSLILNLHDGHGFYRKKNENNIYNPKAWGQTCVIDQCNLSTNNEFGKLNDIAQSVKDTVNKRLLKKHHNFNVKNTKTKHDNKAMQLSLTYFAVIHNKPAFAIETSKNLSSVSQKVFYQLLAIEGFMNKIHIKYKRDFKLNLNSISTILKNYGTLRINGNIFLNLSNIKKSLRFIPIKLRRNKFVFSNPLGMVKKVHRNFYIYIGSKRITILKPQYFKISESCFKKFNVKIDGRLSSVSASKDFYVNNSFEVLNNRKYRVNVIGFHSAKSKESGVMIKLKNLNPRYSVDKNGKVYRVEFYKNNKFCSMSMVHFK